MTFQELLLLQPHLFLVRFDILIGHSDVRMSKQQLRCLDILVLLVVVGSMSGPEVVALNFLAVFLEEAGEPQGKGVRWIAFRTRWKHHSVVRLSQVLPIVLNRIYYHLVEYHHSRGSFLSFELDLTEAVFVRFRASDLIERYVHGVLDAQSSYVK